MLPPFLDEVPAGCSSATARWARCSTRRASSSTAASTSLNLTQPDLVAEVHQDYVRAGADVLETNTFGANRIKLGRLRPRRQGARDQRRRARGSRGTRRATRRTWPARSVRSASASSRGARPASTRREEYFREQAAALLEGGVDLFILETFRDLNEIGAAIAAVRRVCDLPIVAQMTTEEDGNTLDGTPPEKFAPGARAARRARRRRQLQRRSGADARDDRADGAVDRRAALGAAQRRQAARHRGAQHLPLLARVHGVVRAALHRATACAWSAAAAGRRRAHPPDQDRGRRRRPPRRRAVGAGRGDGSRARGDA